ncbi:uncharacterized protein LOC123319340 [Coccinella septempunctata]|uniref:uncharacterized protein LOC123319340 n=1 Tax=Coccinella septempunctata TaxID=41139 RepID=UPI001D069F19|nr:uncharacterized protein LOC123319340 [Coccinella septempunctata]XP_044762190.1 uncharacterized protein LOC123319340 [Coccinella septempunctata]
MSSVLKPSLTASVTQNSPVPPQLNKPMHPQQGPPQSYGQPSNHHSVVSHGNPAAAHNHSATHQSNHFSLNVPNSFIGNNQPIPASNHPVPNNPAQPTQQMYSGAKNMSYQGGFQTNLAHAQNQSSNQLPPVTQSLPATNSQITPHVTEESSDKSHSNGTSMEKSELSQENHVTTPKEISATPLLPGQSPSQSKTPEKTAESQNPAEQENSTETGQNLQKTSLSPAVGQLKTAETAESTSDSTPKESAQNLSEVSVQSENKTEQVNDAEIKEDGEVSNTDEKTGEDKKEPSVAESESANTPNDSEKAVSESVETEVKEKSTPKRSAPRKTSRAVKSEEDSKPTKSDPKPSPSQKSPSTSKSKRARIRTQPYQSPLPELEIISKITASHRNKTNDEKLIVFFKNEFLAVRNPEGSFYVCQAVQNIYKSSAKIRIRWLSLDKNDKTNQIYIPDFYDHTDFDCILTNLNLERIEKGKFRLPPAEKERTDSILKRSLAAEKGEEIPSPTVNEEHPDGLDLSLYKDENQLSKRRARKRKAASPLKSTRNSSRSPNKLSPEKSKLAKNTPKSTKKETVKKETPAAAKKVVPSVTPTVKKTGGSRTDRAKRRSDAINSTKVTPVSPKVDQKKAKALAKVARKSVVQTPKVQTPVKKEVKETKTTTPATKATKTTVKVATSSKKKTPKRSAAKK